MSTTTRAEVSIVRSTKKAHLVQDADGQQFWIQARSLKDGSISERVYQTALKNKAEFVASKQAERAAREAYYTVTVDRETEKAVGTEIYWESNDNEQIVRRMVWFPKSMLRDGQAPGWMIRQNVERSKNEFPLHIKYNIHLDHESVTALGGCELVRWA